MPLNERIPSLKAYEAAVLDPGATLPIPSAEDLKAIGPFLDDVRRLDWSGRCRYRKANAELKGHTSVVFLGDSITENWAVVDSALFTKGTVNRGIGGQVTLEMLGRMQQDVVSLHPKVLHFMGGVNDIARGVPLWETKENIQSILDLAKANGIQVVIGSVLPASRIPMQPNARPAPTILELNVWLKELAAKRCLSYIDYHRVMADAEGGLSSALGNDGIHPHRDGYRPMLGLLKPVLQKALARSDTHCGAKSTGDCATPVRPQRIKALAKCD